MLIIVLFMREEVRYRSIFMFTAVRPRIRISSPYFGRAWAFLRSSAYPLTCMSGYLFNMPSLLAFIAHPDDESYSFGGLMTLAAQAGWRCQVECASYGEHGERHDDGPLNPNALADTRALELEASCRLLGADPPGFWGLPDGELRLHRGEHARIAMLIESFAPSLVLSLGADGAYGHPDHIALHRWVAEAWHALGHAKPPLLYSAFPKGLFLPQYEKCLGMMGNPPAPPSAAIGSNEWHYTLPITSVSHTKRAAIAAHRSQLPGGDPAAIFPPGIVEALIAEERYTDASGTPSAETAHLLETLTGRQ
jgi:LmbE family N-acetylglucosaminyl deacetylase